ncbi:MAG TPA: TolC family protein [Chlorobiota bacterium]|nr:TolC family protein [Chlorobiota bacterium]
MLRLFFAVVVLCAPVAVFGQERSTTTFFSLDDCIRIALEKNLDIHLVNARAESAAANLTAAFGSYLPSASLSANYSRQLTNLREQISFVNGVPLRGAPIPNSYTLNVGANWTLFDGWQRESSYDQARTGVDAADKDITAQRLTVTADVIRRYLAVLRAQQTVNARKESVVLSRQTLDRVSALYAAGRAVVTAKTSQEADVANQEVSVLQAELDVIRAKADLLTVMGLEADLDAEFDLSSFSNAITSKEMEDYRKRIGTEQQAIDRSFTNRPDVHAAEMRTIVAEAGVTGARSGYFPTLTANGGYSWRNFELSDFDRQSQMFVGLRLDVPLFDQFRTNASIEQARLTLETRRIEVERLKQQLRASVRTAYLQLANAERGLEITDIALRAAQLNYDATQERFAVGASNLLDVQTANNQLITAKINRLSAIYSYYDARTLVDLSTGMLNVR